MEHKRIIAEYLNKNGLLPIADTESKEEGLIISVEKGTLHLSGDACALVELADYCVSLALSGRNKGQHWHIDHPYMINNESEITEIIIYMND